MVALAIILLLALVMSTITRLAHADESYNYIEMKVGKFTSQCTRCAEPDGDWPAYVMLGRNFVINKRVNIKAEYLHRSNYDIGWPNKGETGANEYTRDGFFASVVVKF